MRGTWLLIVLTLLVTGCGDSGTDPQDPEALYHSKFEEGFTSLPECQGLERDAVKAFHERRNEGLAGQVLGGEEMQLMNCDYKIRLFAEGREEFRGL